MATRPDTISPLTLLHQRTIAPLDIRTPEERQSDLGFIPGSLHLHTSPGEPLDLTPLQTTLAQAEAVALICLSGRRAEALQAQNPTALGKPVFVLTGGMLAWATDALPTAGLPEPPPPPLHIPTPQHLFRHLLACFSAEATEAILNHAGDPETFQPRRLLLHLFRQAGLDPESPDPANVPRLIDLLAFHSRQLGAPLEHIRDNTNSILMSVHSWKAE